MNVDPERRTIAVDPGIDVAAAIMFHQRGPRDPSLVEASGIVWRASRTPEGVATIAVRPRAGHVDVAAWGPGASWALDQSPRLWGAEDRLTGFDPGAHPAVARAHAAHPRLRLGATDLPIDALAISVLEQKVTGLQAFGAWGAILRRHGEATPGPAPRALFAPPERWDRIPSWAWHRAGVEPPQSRTITAVTRRRGAVERALEGSADRDSVLTSLPGVGAWTSAETRLRAYGDPDAVSVGDVHLSDEVGMALVGERVDDAEMIRLLEPWRGHRQRVIRLIRLAYPAERRGARLHPEDHRSR